MQSRDEQFKTKTYQLLLIDQEIERTEETLARLKAEFLVKREEINQLTATA